MKTTVAPDTEVDPLLVFAAESGPVTAEPSGHTKALATAEAAARRASPPPSSLRLTKHALRISWPAWASAALAVVASVAGLMWMYPRLSPVDAATPRPATLTIVTQPAGVDVLVNGESRGVSPLSLSLAAGDHTVTLRQGTEERVLPLTLSAGAEVTHHIEFLPGANATAARAGTGTSRGGISVVTDPAGAQVLVDGRARGVSPLSLADLPAADYRIRVSGPTGSAERTVSVQAGATASVVFSLPRVSTPAAGWLTLVAPFDVLVTEGNNVVGTGRTAKIMLPAGRHALTLANESLQYSDNRTIDIVAGQTATVSVNAPRVGVSANARPWADVIVDGTNVGQTPIANIPMTIGTHEIVFRHPQLGERRQTVVVTSKGPNRIAVDLTQK
ncbi:MAG TPA: PEGA domain-containing protein [Vicinamibacterales bacterium]|nr:PEGA domain-containing protein [Vicinamibacterales bacterium]